MHDDCILYSFPILNCIVFCPTLTGEALYRFLLSQAVTPPTFLIHCRGTHNETRTRFVSRTDPQGRQSTETETYTETVTDFDFKIKQPVPPRPTQWTVADEEPAYRGRMSREVGLPGDTTKADRSTMKQFKAWRVERHKRGLPPWVGPNDTFDGATSFRTSAVHSMDVLKSSWTLRQWADDYCQSRNIFKEFVYEKVGADLLRPTRLDTHWSAAWCFRSPTDGTFPLLSRQFEPSFNQRILMVIVLKLVSSRSKGP